MPDHVGEELADDRLVLRADEVERGAPVWSGQRVVVLADPPEQYAPNEVTTYCWILREDIILKVILANRTLPVLVDESQIACRSC